jgi:hypothetical protein
MIALQFLAGGAAVIPGPHVGTNRDARAGRRQAQQNQKQQQAAANEPKV